MKTNDVKTKNLGRGKVDEEQQIIYRRSGFIHTILTNAEISPFLVYGYSSCRMSHIVC